MIAAKEQPGIKVWKAIALGWLVVNVPALAIMLAFLLLSFGASPEIWWLFLLLGFFLGWFWWSQAVSRWRRWSLKRGANPERLQRWAVISGLVWRKGSILEKTESRLDDE